MSAVAVTVPALMLLGLYTVIQFSRWARCARPLGPTIKLLQLYCSATLTRIAGAWLACFALNVAAFASLFVMLTVSGALSPSWASWASLVLTVLIVRLPGVRPIADSVLFRLQRAAFSPTLPSLDECRALAPLYHRYRQSIDHDPTAHSREHKDVDVDEYWRTLHMLCNKLDARLHTGHWQWSRRDAEQLLLRIHAKTASRRTHPAHAVTTLQNELAEAQLRQCYFLLLALLLHRYSNGSATQQR